MSECEITHIVPKNEYDEHEASFRCLCCPVVVERRDVFVFRIDSLVLFHSPFDGRADYDYSPEYL